MPDSRLGQSGASRVELSIRLSEVESVDDLADALRGVADEMAARDGFPDDEVGNIETPDGKIVGFWETV